MQRDRALEEIQRNATRILDIASDPKADQSSTVPTCPGWVLADLLNHLGRVYAMVATVISDPKGDPPDRERIPRRPDDQDPADWMRQRLDLVLPMLAEISEDQLRWNFVNGPASPVSFWWRRQLHETLIHRVDAELAQSLPVGDAEVDIAVDGIAERLFLLGFHQARPAELSEGAGMTIHLHATDAPGEWSLDTERRAYVVEHLKGDVALRGPSWSLNRWFWRRGSTTDDTDDLFLPDVEAFGDVPAAEEWRPSF